MSKAVNISIDILVSSGDLLLSLMSPSKIIMNEKINSSGTGGYNTFKLSYRRSFHANWNGVATFYIIDFLNKKLIAEYTLPPTGTLTINSTGRQTTSSSDTVAVNRAISSFNSTGTISPPLVIEQTTPPYFWIILVILIIGLALYMYFLYKLSKKLDNQEQVRS